MKKLVTILMVAVLAVSCICVFAACEKGEPLADTEGYRYVITGQWADWANVADPDDPSKLREDGKFEMEAIAVSDKRVKSIRDQLDDVKLLYIAEHEFTNNKNGDEWEAGWSVTYALTEGAEPITVDGNMAIKIIKTKYETLGDESSWSAGWIPDAGSTTVKSLTPSTFYMPPHSETPTYEGSGAWNDNPIALEAGTYYVVFAAYTNGTFGIGLIAK